MIAVVTSSVGGFLGYFLTSRRRPPRHTPRTVLLGLPMLRSDRVPAAAAWAPTVSQPFHFITAVAVGSRHLDLLAWSLTAVAMSFAARALLRAS